MEPFYSKANQLKFAQPNCLKYLILDFYGGKEEVKKNLLSSCTQLQKFGCHVNGNSEIDFVSQCIRQNSESLKCIEIWKHDTEVDEMSIFKLATAINECQQLEELSLEYGESLSTNYLLPGNLKKLHIFKYGDLKIEDMKVLVDTCSKLEDMFLELFGCCEDLESNLEDSTCRHFDKIISTIVESSLSDTLVNLSLCMDRIVIDEKQFEAKILKIGQMKKLKIIEIYDVCEDDHSHRSKVKEIIRKTLPHLTIVERREVFDDYEARTKISLAHNFFIPADPYAKFSNEYRYEDGFSGFCANPGFWEIPCSRLSMFPDAVDE